MLLEAGFPIVGERDILEGAPEQFLARVAQHIAKLLVHIEPAPIKHHITNANGRVFKGCPEVRLSGLQGFFKLLALADVGANPYPFPHLALLVKQGRGPHQKGAIHAVGPPQAILSLVDGFGDHTAQPVSASTCAVC